MEATPKRNPPRTTFEISLTPVIRSRTYRLMEVFKGHRALGRPLAAPTVALGNFDGVHLGHQTLLDHATIDAHRRGADAVAFTFEPHPAKVLAPGLAPTLITSTARKLELIAERGIDVCVAEPFTRELAGLAPEQFVTEILVAALGAKGIVVGYDFTFGKNRGGNVDMLRGLGAQHGFTTDVVAPVTIEGIVASSTKVRNFVEEGNMRGARLLLGRSFDVEGPVVRGAGRGRTIGIPTANVATECELLPANGVYAVRARLLDSGEMTPWLKGAANIGANPTFTDGTSMSLEIHLLDFDRDIYDRRLRVEFIERLRAERRFEGPTELVGQIKRDIEAARQLLAAI